MECPSCKYLAQANDAFCQNCGKPLREPLPRSPVTPAGVTTSRSRLWPSALFVIAVAAFCVGGYVWYSKKKSQVHAPATDAPAAKAGTLSTAPTTPSPAAAQATGSASPPEVKPAASGPSLATQLVGQWRSSRHLTEFLADGTFLQDADITPEPASGSWRLEGNQVRITFTNGNGFAFVIDSISDQEMSTSDPFSGQKFQSRRERNARIHFDSLTSDAITGNEFAAQGLRITSAGSRLFVTLAPQPPMSMPGGRKQVFMVDGGFVTNVAFEFKEPVRSFTIVLPGLTNGSSYPTFQMTAFDASGQGVDSVGGEHWIPNNPTPTLFTMNSAPMSRVVISVDNRFGDTAWATYNCLPIAEIRLRW